MVYSSLAYRSVRGTGARRGSIIALHGNHQESADILPLATHIAGDMCIEVPNAARGVYEFRKRVTSSWYGAQDPTKPEPASFGDSLAQLEMFIHDAQQRAGTDAPKPWLLGYEQGAVLALTFAVIAPDLISGVMAIKGGLPQFSDPTLIQRVESNLPILLVGNSSDDGAAKPGESTASALMNLGCSVDSKSYNDAGTFPDEVRDTLRHWLQQQSDIQS